ncbi:MAG: hypothetical protein OIN66_03530 [Candidatus Methanoperedens sp.]|nr:hypothetical protein [Candidatus Methanoperedens sp.]
MKLLFAFVLIALSAGTGAAERIWVNNVTVNEYNMTWSYNETFSGIDAVIYRMSIDSELGNNDSFVSAWELLKADKEMRRGLKRSIENEPDVRINNGTGDIQMLEVDSALSPDTIGKAHSPDAVVNKYNVTYRFKDSILNASSIWFLGEANTSMTIIMPPGVDVINISGMKNVTRNSTDHEEIAGFFAPVSKDRGEITLALARNTSFRLPEINVSNTTSPAANATDTAEGNFTKPVEELTSKIMAATIVIAGTAIILLIYIFKLRR